MALLEGRLLSKTYRIDPDVFGRPQKSVRALHNVSFEIERGETLAIVGGSGCGKSTLAKLLVRLLPADSGEILWQGQSIAALTARRYAHAVQMIFQDPYASLNPKLSIGTQLREVLRLSAGGEPSGGRIRERCVSALDRVALPASALDRYPFQFSGGQRQRIAIARALAMEPSLLIADEPLSALDVTIQAQILDLFRELKKKLQLTLMFITHDLAVVAQFCDRVIVLHDGEIIEQGAPAQVLSHPRHAYTRRLLDAVPQLPS